MPYRLSPFRCTCSAALLAVAAVLALPAAAGAAVEIDGPSRPATLPAPPDRAIVVWEPGASRSDRLDARTDADAAFLRTLGDPRFQLVRPEQGQSMGDLLRTLQADPAVRSASRDGYSTVSATTNDPFFNQLWGLLNTGIGIDGVTAALPGADIDVQAAWDRTRGTPSTLVAIIDSGHRLDHPDLGGVTWVNPADPQNGVDDDGNGIVDDARGADFVGRDVDLPILPVDGDPTDDDVIDGGHGIHVAGTAAGAGNDGVGISGVAQDARIMPLRVCSYSPDEEQGGLCPNSAQIQAVNYAGAHGARVANMSLGGSSFDLARRDAIAANPHVLFVVAAGNGGVD
ncbi:MAG TPA: S8 family serine peptidase, partial [Conexibacter sp.]|nr:S8 family serine peptidase [Conexibacter sp.]